MSSGESVTRAPAGIVVETSPEAADPRLRGRTYAVPFEDVWRAALALADGGRRGWTLVSANDETGEISAEARALILRATDDVTIHIVLDEDAQTRVDVRSAARTARPDFGRNTRRVAAFCRALDARIAARAQRDPLYPPGS